MPSFLDPQWLISTFGLVGIVAMVFAESGLLVGFILPGDSLLFTAGLLVADHRYLRVPLWLLVVLVCAAAVAGDQVGYLFGRRTGRALSQRPNTRLLRRENVARAEAFFDRHGPRAIILARFVPIVRTFTPIVAGAAHMRYRTFVRYNVVGGVLWGTGVSVLGYFLGQVAFVRSNIEFILVGIVVVSVLPIAVQLQRTRRRNRRAGEPGSEEPGHADA